MYAVFYAFKTKPNQEQKFIEAWKGLTNLIYKHEGSLGSRLHKKSTNYYIAYAQWPNEDIFKNSGGKLPKEANTYRNLMRASCEAVDILHKAEVVEDLLMDKSKE